MPRTIVPEEQQRVPDLTALRNNIRPTTNRTVHVDSDADGAGNIFRWDPNGEATNADGVSTVASNITLYADGGAEEGLWRRMQLPFVGATTADLSEAGSEADAPAASNRLYFTDARAIDAIEGNTTTLQINNGISMNSSTLTDLPTPSGGTEAATKEYVDGLAQGLEVKDSVDVTATSDVDLASAIDPNPIDGYTLQDGDRILLQGQSAAGENGIYDAVTATDPSTWVRSSDFNEDGDVVSGAFAFVENGTNNGDNSFIVTTDDPIAIGDPITFSQFSSAGELLAGDGLSKSGNTFSVDVSQFAGTFLSDDGSENLQVDVGAGLTNDGSGNVEVDIGVSEDGTSFSTTGSVNKFDFGSSLDVTDNTGSGGGLRLDVNTTDATSVNVKDGGTSINSDVNKLNFSGNLAVNDDGGNQVSINVPDEDIQDAAFAVGGVLDGGDRNRITVSYDGANNNLNFTVDDDLSNYDNSTTDFISGLDIDDGGTDVATNIDNLDFGTNLTVTDNDSTDKTVTLSSQDTTLSIEDGGTQVKAVTSTMNFLGGLSVTDDGANAVSISSDVEFGSETFSGDGVQTEFQIAHGLGTTPSSWTIEATTDDGSGHSHSTADGTNITVFYDTAPPSGTNNIVLNYSLSE